MEIRMRVQAHQFQAPDLVQVQCGAIDGQGNLNVTRPASEALTLPVGSIVVVSVEAEEAD